MLLPGPQLTCKSAKRHLTSHADCSLVAAGKDLAPSNTQLLTQQGGCIAFDGQQTIFR